MRKKMKYREVYPNKKKRRIDFKNTGEMNIYELNGRKFKSCQRALLLRRERINKMMPVLLAALAAFCMIFICAVSDRSIRTNASSGFKYYTSLTVEDGETLWDIADDYVDYNHYKNKNSYITEVQSINHLDENCSIDAGQILILPYYSSQYIR